MVLVTDLQFYMDKNLRANLKEIPRFLNKSYDCVIIVTGHGKVRIGKCHHPEVTTIKVIENGKIIDKKLSEFKDGDFINTLSWDFKNNKQVESISEVIVTDEKDFFEVELDNGKKIVCTKEHKLFVKRNDKIIELKLKDIKEGDEICQN